MVTVHREAGFRFAIYRDDHAPAHVHVIKDGEIIINLVGADGQPEHRQAYGASKAEIRKAMRIVVEQREMFLAKWQEMHLELTDAQIDAANERGRIAQETEPRATSARYDAKTKRIVVELTSGATFAFPPALAQGLCDATAEQLAEIEVSPAGFGLHWPQLDEDYTVLGLMNGIFGTAKWMAAKAGRGTSEAKAAAARANGAKGGRPRKTG